MTSRTKEEVTKYLEEHPEITPALQSALEQVVHAMPDDPMPYLVDVLKGGDAATSAPAAPTGGLLPRPRTAVGKFLRVITINDVYKLDHYPRVATAVNMAKAEAAALDCVVTSHLNGDFLSPCTLTAIDGGHGMTEGLGHAKIDYVCIGNHEFDFGFDVCAARAKQFKGKAINSNVSTAQLSALPKYDVVEVGEKKVLVSGFLTKDTSIYACVHGIPTRAPFLTRPQRHLPLQITKGRACSNRVFAGRPTRRASRRRMTPHLRSGSSRRRSWATRPTSFCRRPTS